MAVNDPATIGTNKMILGQCASFQVFLLLLLLLYTSPIFIKDETSPEVTVRPPVSTTAGPHDTILPLCPPKPPVKEARGDIFSLCSLILCFTTRYSGINYLSYKSAFFLVQDDQLYMAYFLP